MIKSIQSGEYKVPTFVQKGMAAYDRARQESTPVKYADSFIKHAAASTPVLLSLTAVGALMDKSANKVPFKKAFGRNLKGYFVPVILLSSAFLSYIENKKDKK